MPKKILIVDDLLFTRELIKSFFNRRRCTILTANDGKEALDITRKERPDLIIMDLYMPVMNGDESCSLIKSDPQLKSIPIIMASSAWGHEDKKKCLEAGSDNFIKKPFAPDILLKMVKGYIPLSERRAERVSVGKESCLVNIHDNLDHAKAINISTSGMLISVNRHFTASQTIGLNFCLPGFHDALEMEGKVVRTEEIERDYSLNSRWLIGIEFDEEDSLCADTISAFITSRQINYSSQADHYTA